jgi:RNA polymerase sigma-70 factor, ECF subfamily
VLAYATRLVRDRHAAADVVQETFLRAWRHPEVLVRGHGPVRGWLLAVARNIVIDRARAAAIRPQEVADTAIDLGGNGIAAELAAEPDHAERVAGAVAVTSAMAGLSDDHQEVLKHLYWDDRSLADTAATIGISVGTTKSRAHYAIAALRKALSRGDGR